MPQLPHRQPPLLLELDLTRPLIEAEPEDPVGKLRSRGRPRLKATLRALHEAGDDPRVVGLIARVGDITMQPAIAEELRDAVTVFVASGKPAVAFAETFGESANGVVPYLLATGFSEIWMQPSGELGLIGVSAEVTFLRGALDKAGIEPQLDKRYEYKNAADRIMNEDFTDAHRESMDRLAESVWDTVVASITSARGVTAEALAPHVDNAPLSPDEALAAGLIDRIGYRDEVVRRPTATRRHRDDAAVRRPLVAAATRPRAHRQDRQAAPGRWRRAHRRATARIVTGRSRRTLQGPVMGSDTVAAAFRAAREDDRVRAVVFRVDSPGGSYVASDTVWREVLVTREAGKPVVVSMGTMAGSGGYFVVLRR